VLTVPDRAGHASAGPRTLAFSADGERIAWTQAASPDNAGPLAPVQASVIEVASGKELAVLSGFIGPVAHLAFSPDGRRIVSVERSLNLPGPLGEVKIWNADTGSSLLALHWDEANMRNCCFSNDGRRLYTVGLWAAPRSTYLLKPWDGTPREVDR
jgi:WD40 repeat protein